MDYIRKRKQQQKIRNSKSVQHTNQTAVLPQIIGKTQKKVKERSGRIQPVQEKGHINSKHRHRRSIRRHGRRHLPGDKLRVSKLPSLRSGWMQRRSVRRSVFRVILFIFSRKTLSQSSHRGAFELNGIHLFFSVPPTRHAQGQSGAVLVV